MSVDHALTTNVTVPAAVPATAVPVGAEAITKAERAINAATNIRVDNVQRATESHNITSTNKVHLVQLISTQNIRRGEPRQARIKNQICYLKQNHF